MTQAAKHAQPDNRAAPRVHAEFMRVWDEGYVADPQTFVAMHVQGVALLSGGSLRTPDGRLDRSAIMEWVTAATSGLPYARLRLLRSPLGVTPPAWVPDESFDVARHVRFCDIPSSCSAEALPALIGWDEGPLEIDRPLWRVQFTPLEDGRVAMGLLLHHSSGDALRTLKLLTALTGNGADAVPERSDDPFADERAPSAVELPVVALRAWLGSGTGLAERWREYWRKPLHRRARRVGGRMLRPVRAARLPFAGRPTRRAAYFTVSSDLVQGLAAQHGVTMSDVVVAASLRAGESEASVPSVRVPVMRRRGEDSRNRVADLSVVGQADSPFAELATSVGRQLRAVRDNSGDGRADSVAATGDADSSTEIGYATLVPWLSRPRYLLAARLDELIVLPAASPQDALSTFTLLYNGMLTVVASTPASADIDSVLASLRETMTGSVAEPTAR